MTTSDTEIELAAKIVSCIGDTDSITSMSALALVASHIVSKQVDIKLWNGVIDALSNDIQTRLEAYITLELKDE